MRYHKTLEADRLRKMPWKTQVGMIASELSRVYHLTDQESPEVMGCLQRARELLGVLESSSRDCAIPQDVGIALCQTSRDMAHARLREAAAKAETLYHRLMALYRSTTQH